MLLRLQFQSTLDSFLFSTCAAHDYQFVLGVLGNSETAVHPE
nr:MAG TPA: hypothetical protein [Caudoviricetes sp.]